MEFFWPLSRILSKDRLDDGAVYYEQRLRVFPAEECLKIVFL
jgi:hypothetical protein